MVSSLSEVQTELDAIDWGPSAPLRVRYSLTEYGPSRADWYMLTGRIDVPERDQGDQMLPIYVSRVITLPINGVDLLREAELLAKELYIHEMQEAFLYRGIRVLDPHK